MRAAVALAAVAACTATPTRRELAEAAVARAKQLFADQSEAHIREAIASWDEGFALWGVLGELHAQADVAGDLGDAWDNLGDMTQAFAWSSRALELYRATGDSHGEAMALSWVGIAEVHLDRMHDALAHFDDAARLARGKHDDAYAYALLNTGFALEKIDAWRDSEAAIAKALPIFEKLGDRVSIATCHNNIGANRGLIGDARGALEHHEAALAIRIADGHKIDIGWSQVNLGGVYLDLLGDAAKAVEHFRAAKAVWLDTGNKLGVPLAVGNLARALAALGRFDDALAAFDEALAGYRAVKGGRGIAEATVDRAEVLVTLGRPAARDELVVGLLQSLAYERPSYAARALLGLARLDVAGGKLDDARREVDRAIALLEGLRIRAIREEHRRSFFATVQGSFELRVRIALAAGDVADGFAASERARARTLIDALASAGGALRAAAPIDAATAEALLDPGTELVSFVLDDGASHAFVTDSKGVRVVTLPSRAEITAAARHLFDVVSRAPAGPRDPGEAALAKLVVEPLGLAAARVVVVPDGALHFVPFAELPGLRDRNVVYLPSATALAELRRRPAAKPPALELAVLADPIFASDDPRVTAPHPPAGPTLARLRYSRREADGIAALVAPARRFVATDAAADLGALRAAATARVVHLATHAIVDSDEPEASAIVLSQVTGDGVDRDDRLRLPDIEHLAWAAELVVISGCRTALGKEIRGEGMVGLVDGFFRAGARRVVASLWSVDDRATAELMIRFHANLASQPPAAALAAAQRAIAADPRWRDPYYWAGFALYGDWK